MVKLVEDIIDIQGIPTRLLRGGSSQAQTVLFLHGGTPGVTPYCSGTHIWGDATLSAFAGERQVVVPDLPGSGATPVLGDKTMTLDAIAGHVSALLDTLKLDGVHLVGHDIGGLMALVLAMEKPARLASVSIVGSGLSAPLGDGLDDIVFLNPPEPRWSRLSQGWALDRISHSQAGLDDGLLDACVASAAGAPHRAALATMAGDGHARIFAPSVTRAKFRLWEIARGQGLQVPVQLVWGNEDPTTSRERGTVLFDTLAKKQTATHFHIVNRAGNLVFRDQPETFHQIVAAFQDGVVAEKRRAAGAKQ